MKNNKLLILLLFQVVSLSLSANNSTNLGRLPYHQRDDVQQFMYIIAYRHGFQMRDLNSWFSQVQYKQSIIDVISNPPETKLTWGKYRDIFIQDSRIDKGIQFWQDNQFVLQQIEEQLGIPPAIIVAIIGVESYYGTILGNYRVIDSLSTLAFNYPKRSQFFTQELEQFLLLAREQGKSPLELSGSYAGAMGLGQFMPSSYRAYAKDYDADGFIDIWNNQKDAIWSVANYLAEHNWSQEWPITFSIPVALTKHLTEKNADTSLKPTRKVIQLKQIIPNIKMPNGVDDDALATLIYLQGEQGPEYWVGLYNFYVITRYNHSKLYAMAVFQLAQEIAKRSNASSIRGSE